MNIALIAHEKKNDLMVDFCVAYKKILQEHTIFAASNIGNLIAEATGLTIQRQAPGTLGSEQQIAARVSYNEIDMVIFLRDPFSIKESLPDINSLLRLCDIHSIPVATNIATAEILIKGLERGDLAFRELL